MAFTDPGDIASNDIVTEAYLDSIRASLLASAPGVVTTKGDIVAATGANAVARVAAGANDSILVYDSGESAGIVDQIVPAVRVYNSGALDPDTESWTFDSGGSAVLTFDSERFDTNTMHSTSSNTGRLTVPTNGDGLYLIGATVQFDTSGQTSGEIPLGLRILLNGATVIAEDFRTQATRTGGDDMAVSISTLYSLSATDYVELQCWTEANVNILATSAFSPEFWAIWQRRQ